VRKLNDDYDINDPNLADFIPVARNTCSNIADNPIHPTLQVRIILLYYYTTIHIHTVARNTCSNITDNPIHPTLQVTVLYTILCTMYYVLYTRHYTIYNTYIYIHTYIDTYTYSS
jgi:hypothetical protein